MEAEREQIGFAVQLTHRERTLPDFSGKALKGKDSSSNDFNNKALNQSKVEILFPDVEYTIN